MRRKRHPKELLKEAAAMVRFEANVQAMGEPDDPLAKVLRDIARNIERIRLTEDVK